MRTVLILRDHTGMLVAADRQDVPTVHDTEWRAFERGALKRLVRVQPLRVMKYSCLVAGCAAVYVQSKLMFLSLISVWCQRFSRLGVHGREQANTAAGDLTVDRPCNGAPRHRPETP